MTTLTEQQRVWLLQELTNPFKVSAEESELRLEIVNILKGETL